jgi:hypothetical protein
MSYYERLLASRQERRQKVEMIIFGAVIFVAAVYFTANVLEAVRAGRWPM